MGAGELTCSSAAHLAFMVAVLVGIVYMERSQRDPIHTPSDGGAAHVRRADHAPAPAREHRGRHPAIFASSS
jgi:hypothetical protein